VYKCKLCGTSTERHNKIVRAVIAERPVTYPDGFVGVEIAKEVQVCSLACPQLPEKQTLPMRDLYTGARSSY
jgi:hypothetical protein